MDEFDALLGCSTDRICADDLAALLGISVRQVRALAQRGIIQKANNGNGYACHESIRSYCANLREQAAGRSGGKDLTQERIRVAKEQADSLEMKNALARGELVPARTVEAAWATTFREVCLALCRIPARIQQRAPHLNARDVAGIDREIRDVLTEVGNGEI